jgi:hypothetical protein
MSWTAGKRPTDDSLKGARVLVGRTGSLARLKDKINGKKDSRRKSILNKQVLPDMAFYM